MLSGLPGYFVGEDGHGDLCVWRERGDYPVPVLGRREIRDDPDLWDAIVVLVEGES